MKTNFMLKLSRRKGVRELMLANMFVSLVKNGVIVTTRAKAKALKQFGDRVIHKCVQEKYNVVRKVLRFNKQIRDVIDKCKALPKREGGYISIIRVGTRKGDATDIYEVRIIDYDKIKKAKSSNKKER